MPARPRGRGSDPNPALAPVPGCERRLLCGASVRVPPPRAHALASVGKPALPNRPVLATARRFVKAIASQHASGAMWRLPGQTRPSRGLRQSRGLDPRCGARAAPRTRPPHRPDWQRLFRDGRAGRSRGPCRRGVTSTGRLDRAGLQATGQCVSAWGRNSNAGSAEQASFAARNGCESWGRSLLRPLGPGRHRWSGHRSGQGRSGRRLPGAHHLGPVSGTGSRMAPRSGPGAARWRR